VKITNKFNVPKTLVNFMERDTYTRGSCHISVTQLIDAPRIKILKEKHQDDIVLDVADSLWSLVGKALHHVAEAGADEQHLAEERLYADVLGWRLSGGIDVQKHGGKQVGIRDYKFTSVYAATAGKPEWERQLNAYSYLARVSKGWVTQDLEICALLRDWSRLDARRNKDYPQAPIMVVPIDLWPDEQQDAYIEARIKAHQKAWTLEEWGEELPACTAEDRWSKPDKFAVMRRGGKRASGVFMTVGEAHAFVVDKPDAADFDIQLRAGEQTRCENYCSAAPWCSQWQDWVRRHGRQTHQEII
jgi:hypothetical protein